jgi:hypothetical protein
MCHLFVVSIITRQKDIANGMLTTSHKTSGGGHAGSIDYKSCSSGWVCFFGNCVLDDEKHTDANQRRDGGNEHKFG